MFGWVLSAPVRVRLFLVKILSFTNVVHRSSRQSCEGAFSTISSTCSGLIQSIHCLFLRRVLSWMIGWVLSTPLVFHFSTTILVIIFSTFATLQYRSNSPQVKRNMMPSIANLVYELPNDFLKDFRLRILKNKKILGKSQIWVMTPVPSLLSTN